MSFQSTFELSNETAIALRTPSQELDTKRRIIVHTEFRNFLKEYLPIWSITAAYNPELKHIQIPESKDS